jgi:hypothetical protein
MLTSCIAVVPLFLVSYTAEEDEVSGCIPRVVRDTGFGGEVLAEEFSVGVVGAG